VYKSLKECQFMDRIINNPNFKCVKQSKDDINKLKLSDLTDLI